MSREPLVLGDMPLSVRIIMIGGSIFLGPYLIIRALYRQDPPQDQELMMIYLLEQVSP